MKLLKSFKDSGFRSVLLGDGLEEAGVEEACKLLEESMATFPLSDVAFPDLCLLVKYQIEDKFEEGLRLEVNLCLDPHDALHSGVFFFKHFLDCVVEDLMRHLALEQVLENLDCYQLHTWQALVQHLQQEAKMPWLDELLDQSKGGRRCQRHAAEVVKHVKHANHERVLVQVPRVRQVLLASYLDLS